MSYGAVMERLGRIEDSFDRMAHMLQCHMEREEKLMADQPAATAFRLRELANLDNGRCVAEVKKVEEVLEGVTGRQRVMRSRITALSWVTGTLFIASMLFHWALERGFWL